ncbi:hypothetical protein ABZT47_09005 [Sphaerisporangium sp. NPDC005289]|uniref:hypothetical protein n=1 Tax=Sphaerisporangium sp. NPDC005289 TaxID=3155247 RepID=UPI0033BF4398
MDFDDDAGAGTEDALDEPQLPRHLAALVGALQGPADLGVHHDWYLTYPHREESDGAIIA